MFRGASWGSYLALWLAMMATFACRPKARANPPSCTYEVATHVEETSESMTPRQWLTIVSPGIDRASLTRRGPLSDACGGVIEAQAPQAESWPACPGLVAPAVPRVADRVEVSDLILSQVGEGRILAWAATEELVSGDVLGAAALVFWTEMGLEVHAIGVLRGLREGARLRLHHSDGVAVVILESQVCEGIERCERVAKFFPIVARRFADVPVLGPEGACLGEASFPLHHELDVTARAM